MFKNILVLCSFLICGIDSARILGVFPIPAVSHQKVFTVYAEALAKQGHELVVITPNPVLLKDKNMTIIDVGFSYEILAKVIEDAKTLMKRGVIIDVDAITSTNEGNSDLVRMVAQQLNHPEVKKLIEEKQHFDLIIVEALMNYQLILTKIFNAPAIQISSLYGTPNHYEAFGALSRHPIFYPDYRRNKFSNLNFWEKLNQIYVELKLVNKQWALDEIENELLKEQYGPDAPTITELKKNIAVLFLNSHPIFDNNRSVPPNVKYLGALHLQPVQELPTDLKKYLDSSKRGVIYVSMGTNVRPSQMDKEFLNAFLSAFQALPYDILWKFDEDNLEGIPKNVKIGKWFPQRDLLMHPNVKVFVTQGGLQSTDEAIDAGVPLVGIPILGDQWYNSNKYEELGIGVAVDSHTMTAEDLVKAVKKVVENESYVKNIKYLRKVINDQPLTPIQRAVWWTEYVLRHPGAKLIRSPAANISWSEYFMLDIALPVSVAFILFSFSMLATCVKLCPKPGGSKLKMS